MVERRRPTIRRLALGCASVAFAAISVSACSWYIQAISGNFRIMRERQPVAKLLAAPATPESLRQWLQKSGAIRDFASLELALPDNDSFRMYADLKRDQALWIVVAAPEFSLTPKSWCYLIVGCQNYRGYFSLAAAERKAEKLSRQGFDTALLPSGAYSTLGWFADPLLDSMRGLDDWALAELIFHELAHQALYIDGDTRFNESFADFVAATGVERWLAADPDTAQETAWHNSRSRRAKLHALLDKTRQQLTALYASGQDKMVMRPEKLRILAALHQALDDGGFKFEVPYNNARLANEADYHSGMAQFAEVFTHCRERFPDFYRAMKRIGDWPKDRRQAWLNGGREDPAALCAGERENLQEALHKSILDLSERAK